MEAKLKEYRELRRRKELEKAEKERIALLADSVDIMSQMDKNKEDELVLINNDDNESNIDATSETSDIESCKNQLWSFSTVKWSVYFGIWLMLYMFFLRLQFGAVFFVISVLIGICLNTRTRPKKAGEVSAYSVFNENCENIEGTLTAEQFEKEIRFGPGSV
ncbi:SAYSvFN domain-containing protein 1 [Eumeta japonica]|uniref:SAYSvFN domain-containing protein 1 n=1 Tax=Eumeta variegata TaxID=151549 RepID=A0A4C1TV72_EUMVA|nr:SAYSvFN domain-containing protein 1 [Eumeta japonica]